jgi:RNA-binding protein
MLAHNAVLRVHCHATEEEDRVRQALALLAGRLTPGRTLAEGHYKNPIVILEVVAQKKQADAVWGRVQAAPSVAERLSIEAERRVDDAGVFYARFDKQRAFQGELIVTQSDDAIRLRSKVAAFPQRKGPAVKSIRDFLGASTPPKA